MWKERRKIIVLSGYLVTWLYPIRLLTTFICNKSDHLQIEFPFPVTLDPNHEIIYRDQPSAGPCFARGVSGASPPPPTRGLRPLALWKWQFTQGGLWPFTLLVKVFFFFYLVLGTSGPSQSDHVFTIFFNVWCSGPSAPRSLMYLFYFLLCVVLRTFSPSQSVLFYM